MKAKLESASNIGKTRMTGLLTREVVQLERVSKERTRKESISTYYKNGTLIRK